MNKKRIASFVVLAAVGAVSIPLFGCGASVAVVSTQGSTYVIGGNKMYHCQAQEPRPVCTRVTEQ